jgi:hypothetical protein
MRWGSHAMPESTQVKNGHAEAPQHAAAPCHSWGAMAMQDTVSPCAFTPVRLTQLDKIIQLRLKNKYALAAASRFTLHSVTGFRMPDGRLQVERIAGFCHLRNCLKNYWVEQIDSLQDPATSEDIADLAQWLALHPPPPANTAVLAAQDAAARRADARADVAQARQRITVIRAVDKAIACATSRGLDDVASRLTKIREALEDGTPPSHDP